MVIKAFIFLNVSEFFMKLSVKFYKVKFLLNNQDKLFLLCINQITSKYMANFAKGKS
jgi:hypothetical protein